MRRQTTALFMLLAAVVGGLFTGTTPASAADVLSRTAGISYFDCDSGAALIVCTATIDGTPPFSITWKVNGVEQPFFKNSSTLRVGCVVGRPFDVQIAVTDAGGASATDRAAGVCRRIQE
ncbi:hypothetical protein [Nonomuraea lactucae]|uniref:hypothetical protein n=1 Tax=Nonomuraea lactucae TaxID=2249762 RepID=UPI0013B42435|nr:hypothetical protein [Nonomuraea lactucae]